MNWKVKAFIQNFVACLPRDLSNEVYFQIQRHFGGLKKPFNPLNHISVGVKILKKIIKYGNDIIGKTFFEVGTGRVPLIPVAFWLGGANKTITVDLNSYMRNELVEDLLFYIKNNTEEFKKVFEDLLQNERFEELLKYTRHNKINKEEFLRMCNIEYIAPCDAANTSLENNSIDYHISHTVYEHIPMHSVKKILEEGNRIIKSDGLFINFIDYADHFALIDKNISAINFLQYNDNEWKKYAGNRFMYMNRARHDEFVELFKLVEHDFIEIETHIDEEALRILKNKMFQIDDKFKSKNTEILSITNSWFITKYRGKKNN